MERQVGQHPGMTRVLHRNPVFGQAHRCSRITRIRLQCCCGLFETTIHMHEFKWSPSEKAIARRAFNQALQSELQQLVRQAKDRAAAVTEASELWKLESWLAERRREIDRKYDYRYSVLPLVFAQLVKQGRVAKSDLHGLDPEKIQVILGMASRL